MKLSISVPKFLSFLCIALTSSYVFAYAAITIPSLDNGTSVLIDALSRGSHKYYSISIPTGATNLTVRTTGVSGDPDIYMSKDLIKSNKMSTWKSNTAKPDELIVVQAPISGLYYIAVYAYRSSTKTTLTASYKSPIAAQTLSPLPGQISSPTQVATPTIIIIKPIPTPTPTFISIPVTIPQAPTPTPAVKNVSILDPIPVTSIPQAPTSTVKNVSILDFGAIAGGTTDTMSAIGKAITVAKIKGLPVYIPEGTFAYQGVIRLDGVKMYGAGPASKLYALDYTNESIFLYGNGAEVRSLTLDGVVPPSRLSAWEATRITAFAASNFVVDSVTILNSAAAGIQTADGGSNGSITNNIISNTLADSIHIIS